MYRHDDIWLSKLEEEDLGALWSLKSESWATTHNVTIANHQDQHRWFVSLDQHVHSPRNLVLVAETTCAKVGIFKVSNADYVSRTADAAWDIFKSHRGKGIGKKLVAAGSAFCFEILNLRRLTAEILSINEASKKCAQAAGYVHEGTKRQLTHKNGEYLDSEVWGLLRPKLLD